MTSVSYLLQALLYSAAGFAAGYAVCWITRRAAEDGAAGGHRVEWWRIPIGVLLLVLVAYSTISATRFNACQRDTNTQFVDALGERGAAQRDWIEAQEVFLDATAAPGATPASRAAAYQRYREALTQLKTVQAANPLQVRDCS
jgi:hypothetical protein